MRALRCNSYGPPSGLVIENLPDPRPGPGQIVVGIEAAGVNYPDTLIAANRYQVSVPVPFTPGSEFAGRVQEVGEGVISPAVGQVVRGSSMVGAFAERIAVSAASVSPVPDGVDFEAAAAFGVAHATAYHALRSVAGVHPEEWVLVLGAAGGVGLAAVEVARLLGARVLAAASTSAKLAVCSERGAEATVDYSAEDLKLRARELTGGGPHVVIDPVGGPYSEPALRAGRPGCRFVTVGFASGQIPRIPLNLVLLKDVAILGFDIRTFSTHHAPEAERDRAELEDLLASGRLRPYVSASYPLSEAAAALQLVADRGAVGKVVIRPGG
jgi:NADPH2:quinone reductase